MAYASPLSQKFQDKFNELMIKKGITAKKDVLREATKFFSFCVNKINEGGNCPFPIYLYEEYLKIISKKS